MLFFFKVDSPKENACDHWHPPKCSVHQKKGTANFGVECAFKRLEKAGGEPKKGDNSVVAATTLGQTQAEDKITSLKITAKEDLLQGVSTMPVKSNLQSVGENIVNKFRLARVAERFL